MTTVLTQRFKRNTARVLAAGLAISMLVALWVRLSGPLELRALNWLQERQSQAPSEFDLASVSSMDALSEPQALLVSWLSRKYRVAQSH